MPQKRFTRSNPAWLTRLGRISLASAAVLSGTVTALLVAAPFASAAPTAPPPLTFLTSSGPVGHGDIFITPTGDTSTYANGPEILSPNGNVVWFHPIPQGDAAGDFRTQRYEGKPVLTFWVGTGFGGLSSGTDYIYNDHYQQIAAVNAGNG